MAIVTRSSPTRAVYSMSLLRIAVTGLVDICFDVPLSLAEARYGKVGLRKRCRPAAAKIAGAIGVVMLRTVRSGRDGLCRGLAACAISGRTYQHCRFVGVCVLVALGDRVRGNGIA
jgi:hypothetical protein